MRQSLAHHGGIPGEQNFPVSATRLSSESCPSPTLRGSWDLNLGPPALQVPYPLNRPSKPVFSVALISTILLISSPVFISSSHLLVLGLV